MAMSSIVQILYSNYYYNTIITFKFHLKMILNVLYRKITIYFQTSFLYMYTSYYNNNKCINGEL